MTAGHIAILQATFESAVYAESQQVDFAAFAEQTVRSLSLIQPYLELLGRKLASGDSSVEGATLDVYIAGLEGPTATCEARGCAAP